MRIFETHEHTQKWVKEFGLELGPYDTGTRAFHLQGKRFFAPAAGEPWPPARPPALAGDAAPAPPGATGHARQVTGVVHKAWQEDPWAGGGWGWTQPHELAWMFPAMREAEGRVHFAGEHTSLWIAWMKGALESASASPARSSRRGTLEMPNVGPTELAIVLVLALLILGPKRLPAAGRSLGEGCASSGERSAAIASTASSSWHDERMPYDETLAERIRKQLGAAPGITERRMFGGLAFLVDGHMAVAASGQGGLLVRAEPAEADALLADGAAEPMVMNGRPMKAWLRVAAAEVAADDALERWVAIGTRYAGSLPPKSAR